MNSGLSGEVGEKTILIRHNIGVSYLDTVVKALDDGWIMVEFVFLDDKGSQVLSLDEYRNPDRGTRIPLTDLVKAVFNV